MISLMLRYLVMLLICPFAFPSQIIQFPFEIVDEGYSDKSNLRGLSLAAESPIQINDNQCYLIKVSVGSHKQSLRLKLTTQWNGLFLLSGLDKGREFNSRESTSFYLIEKKVVDKKLGLIFTDTLRIANTDLLFNNFLMVILEDSPFSSHYEGYLGFGLEDNRSGGKIKDLASVLYDKSIITNQKISVTHLSLSSGVLTIGDLPNDIKANKKKYKSCSITQPQEWHCMLNSIYFEDGSMFQVNAELGIALGGNIFQVPGNFYDLIIEKYFKEEITSKKCHSSPRGGFETLCCKRNYSPYHLPSLSLVIGKWTIKMRIADLFYLENNSNDELCSVLVYKKNNWFISPSIMNKYTVVLDKDNLAIGFYKGD